LVNIADIRCCCFFISFFSKAQLGFKLREKLWDFVRREGFNIFSWMSCWGVFGCLHLKETTLTISGLLHSDLVVGLKFGGDSEEVETWVDSGEISTEVKG
jgi:hypothetical protein